MPRCVPEDWKWRKPAVRKWGPRAIHLQRRCAQLVWWPLLVRSAWWGAAGELELWERQLSLPLLPGGRQDSFKPVSPVPLPITIWPVGVCCRLSSGERLHRVGLIFTINPENPAHSCLLSKYAYDVFNAKSVVLEFISSAMTLRIEDLSIPSSRGSWVFPIPHVFKRAATAPSITSPALGIINRKGRAKSL